MAEFVSIQDLTNTALDEAYAKVALPMLRRIAAIFRVPHSQMQRSLADFEAEVKLLEENEKRLKYNNAQLQQTLAVYNRTLNSAGELIDDNSGAIQLSGQAIAVPMVTAKVFFALSGTIIKAGSLISTAALNSYISELAARGIRWETPSSLDFAKRYVNTATWNSRMAKWGDGYADIARQSALKGINQGWGPKTTAAYIRNQAENLPVHAAENLTRTLQLTSLRDASAAMELQNAHAIITKIRVAHLDDLTCLSCISLHGTELELGMRVDDHYRGRCTEFYVVPGGPQRPERMQSDSRPGKRNFVPYQNGNDWFAGLPLERQSRQASFRKTPAKFKAFQEGTPLNAFVKKHDDDLFGSQIVEDSLIGALGKRAQKFYIHQP